MKEWLSRLRDHMEWADAAVIDSLLKRGASSKVEGIAAHILAAEHVWLTRARGTAATVPVWPRLSLPECTRLAAENAAGYRSLLASTDEQGLSRGVAYTNSKGERFESRLDDIFLHVFMHGSYHRGQVAVLQRSDGREPLLTDFIHFVRTVRDAGALNAPARRYMPGNRALPRPNIFSFKSR